MLTALEHLLHNPLPLKLLLAQVPFAPTLLSPLTSDLQLVHSVILVTSFVHILCVIAYLAAVSLSCSLFVTRSNLLHDT